MMKLKSKYPCGMEIELMSASLWTFLFGGLISCDDSDYKKETKWDCPLHGKNCKPQKK